MKNVPPPSAATGGPLKALIYDSVYDEYKVQTSAAILMFLWKAEAGGVGCGPIHCASMVHPFSAGIVVRYYKCVEGGLRCDGMRYTKYYKWNGPCVGGSGKLAAVLTGKWSQSSLS